MRKQKGITLIALVITIIVLLILAGVTISMVVGDNGILTRADKAKTNTEEGKNKEQENIVKLENMVIKSEPKDPEELPSEVKVTRIVLEPEAIEIKEGEEVTLIATVEPSNATNKNIKWTSDKTDIVTVDQTGKVIGVKEGTAIITATAEDGSGVTANCNITVQKKATTGWVYQETFSSPNYPENYPNSQNIVTERDYGENVKGIKIVIKDLELEGGCNYDYVLVFGKNENSLIERICSATSSDANVLVPGNYLKFNFVTDGSVTRKGYLFDVYTTECEQCFNQG